MSFGDLIKQGDATVEALALAAASALDASIEPSREVARIDALAAGLSSTEGGVSLEALLRHGYGALDFSLAGDYDEPQATLLPSVVTSRRGTPVALGVLLISLGARVGRALDGVAYPGNFLVRDRESGVLVDPADGRAPLPRDRMLELAIESLGGDKVEAERRLEPVAPRAVIAHLLLNLQRAYRSRADHGRGLVVADMLFEVTESAHHLVDRGALALIGGAARAAIADFEAYLRFAPQAPDADAVRRVIDRANAFMARPLN
ncbi:MAG: transglutaminase family protein [Polyangiaceae bacterium]